MMFGTESMFQLRWHAKYIVIDCVLCCCCVIIKLHQSRVCLSIGWSFIRSVGLDLFYFGFRSMFGEAKNFFKDSPFLCDNVLQTGPNLFLMQQDFR